MSEKKSGIWITGASSGIGKAAAIEFARTGCKVFVSARRATELERLNQSLKKEKLEIDIYPCNIASSANVDQTAKKILSTHKIDCLINNAGITSFKLAEENSINEIDDIINTNLLGSIYTIKSVLPKMIEQGGGTIINILSTVTKKIFTNSSAYAASKSGLKAYADVLREEVRKYRIKVVNIIPGATVTPMWSQEVRKESSERMMSVEDISRLLVWVFLQKENMVSEEIFVRPIEGDL
ncbi:MAG: SDR family oxidoreductase [Ignavibacteriales bacterium]|nr:MAG: SDR family oxidoreductase [Ignavibacteriales bacterium]